MRAIWKYAFPERPPSEFQRADVIQVQLSNPQVRLVAAERNRMVPTVWIEHDPDEGPETLVTLQFFGTGHEVPTDMTHVGSAVCGPFVWHVYARREESDEQS